jgi:hypothetical protein
MQNVSLRVRASRRHHGPKGKVRTLRIRVAIASLLLLSTTGCGSNNSSSTSSTPAAPQSATREYNGTASVGDFLTITLDSTAHTLTYTNHSNGDAATVPYTVNSDGTYTLSDPAGNLVAAYEVPNYALLIQATKTGPNHDTKALITAIESSPISLSTMESHNYNYMQFRTAAGGFEAGSVKVDAQGNIAISSYWPFGAQNQQSSPFNTGGFPSSSFQEDSSGDFLTHDDGQGSYDFVFATQNGIFAVDSPNGAILGLQKAASKDFDPTFAGSYKAIYYQKTGASTGQGNVETGTPNLGNAMLVVMSNGRATLQDAQSNVLAQGTLAPVADTSYLYGANGELTDPCFGLFTFRVTTGNSQQDVFMTFQGRAVLFSSFQSKLPQDPSNTYDYFYGVAVK